MRKVALAMLAVALILSGSAPAAALAPAAPQFARGINVLGYDPFWKDPAKAQFQWRHFIAIRKAGFNFVRVNLFAFDRLDSHGKLDPAWLKSLDLVIAEARKAGLGVILDEHDFDSCADDAAACARRLSQVWRQLAPRYRNQPKSVAFELLNEPHGALDAPTWNALLLSVLAEVRRSNPDRWVIVGPTHWNSLADLPLLQLPANDRRLIVTFHYYEPFKFTHQGASWTDNKDLHGVTWGTASDRARLATDFVTVAEWARVHRRPILLGEFGAYDGSGTPMPLRVAYTSAVAREAERNHFAWAYWQFSSDFVAWDMKRDAWVEPIRDALIPPAGQP